MNSAGSAAGPGSVPAGTGGGTSASGLGTDAPASVSAPGPWTTGPGHDPGYPASGPGLGTGIPEPGAGRTGRVLGWLAVAGIGTALLIMIAASLVRGDWMFPHLVIPSPGPPWTVTGVRVPAGVIYIALWISAAVGAGGVAVGLLAAQRGARPPMRLLLTGALIAVVALTVLPPVGSSDAFDYAAYGRIALLGHSPYVLTPSYLRHAHTAFSLSVPRKWQHAVSVYGPLATAEQFFAAKLGGLSMARVTFWLKLWNSIVFLTVALVMDRLLRADPVWRLRAHLLWTVNPLLLWDLIAAGHLDVLAAGAGLLGLLALGTSPGAVKVSLPRVIAAGALIGVAADIKINYLLFGVGLAWALRRSPARLAAAACGGLAVLGLGYAWYGIPAVKAILKRRNTLSANSFYLHLVGYNHRALTHIGLIALVLVVAAAALLLWRAPAGLADRPAIRPALAVCAAWLFFWPYQLPWYDAMLICLLVFYPASWFDWLVLARLAAGTLSNIPGNPWSPASHLAAVIEYQLVGRIAPLLLFGAAIALVLLACSGRWRPYQLELRPAVGWREQPELVSSTSR
jgi:hypothetical protein